MALRIDPTITPKSLLSRIERMFELSARKIRSIEKTWSPRNGTPVFTVAGRYTSRGWTEWTEGFQYGASFLQFDATGDKQFLKLAQARTVERMASHVSHIGVHDHGFNNISTYGHWLRLINEGKISGSSAEKNFCELALKVSGAVQAARWTDAAHGLGYIYSFNGPHSLFIDTVRSLRSLAVAHKLGHVLMAERDRRISLLERLLIHARTTAKFAVYYGAGRDAYDVSGRTAHESIFNINDGAYRCPNSQQGYSPFSTWTRGLTWAICGFTEQLEFLASVPKSEFETFGGFSAVEKELLRAAIATADFYLKESCMDGIPIWDTGAPNLHRLGEYKSKPGNPFNPWEPVDSSAAAIAAQGFLRLGKYLAKRDQKRAHEYSHAGITILSTLLSEPYLSTSPKHQGLLLHSVYHRPNGWDYIAKGQSIPNGESSMWGDFHLREAALMVLRLARNEPYFTFFSGL